MAPSAEFVIDPQSPIDSDQITTAATKLQTAASQRQLPVEDDFEAKLQSAIRQTQQLVREWQAQRSRS